MEALEAVHGELNCVSRESREGGLNLEGTALASRRKQTPSERRSSE